MLLFPVQPVIHKDNEVFVGRNHLNSYIFNQDRSQRSLFLSKLNDKLLGLTEIYVCFSLHHFDFGRQSNPPPVGKMQPTSAELFFRRWQPDAKLDLLEVEGVQKNGDNNVTWGAPVLVTIVADTSPPSLTGV